ncbi:MAG: DUF2807 domain-containing protein [Mariniphaga sp.]|nr:DUF2807 domain-containing protein [Mariniphaga sp.]
MKTTKQALFFVLILLTAASTTVQAGNSKKTEIRKVGNFNAVDVSAGIDLYLKMGETEEVRVEADDDIIENILTEVKNGTLHVYMKKGNFFNIFNILNFGNTSSRKVYVTVTDLKRIDASSGSDVRSENTLKGDVLIVNSSSGSDVVLDVVYKDISLDASSGADIKVSGKAKTVRVSASSGSDINARNLAAVIGHANASSGADVVVHATGEIYANASSGGDVRYYGNPLVKNIDESSGGDVSQR